MLKPAIMYKSELTKKFSEQLYTQDYFYYNGYPCGSCLPKICEQEENLYQYAIVDNGAVVGYLSYRIETLTDCVDNFGLYSFDKGNRIIGIDLHRKLKELLKHHHRLEWRVIDTNPVKRHYDNFCKRHNGNIVCLHDVTKDMNGNYLDEYIYEIISDKT